MPERGIFVTFEGLDGSGKSTHLRLLSEWLQSQGYPVITTREPGGNEVSDRIRSLLLDSRTLELSPYAELALMFASRAQNIRQVIIPALDAGKFVLCDRFTDSSEAYQGAGRGLGTQAVLDMHRLLCQGVHADVTFLLLADPALSVERARERNRGERAVDENRFEQEGAAFYERVRDGFLRIAEREPERVVKIRATGPVEDTHRKVVAALQERLQRPRLARSGR